MAFWNVAIMRRKGGDFWKGLEEWDVMIVSETWLEEREWEWVEKKLPRGYEKKERMMTKKVRMGGVVEDSRGICK